MLKDTSVQDVSAMRTRLTEEGVKATLHIAAENGQPGIVDISHVVGSLSTQLISEGATAIVDAAGKENKKVVEILVKAGTDVDGGWPGRFKFYAFVSCDD